MATSADGYGIGVIWFSAHPTCYVMLLKLPWVCLQLIGKFAYLAGGMSVGPVGFYYEFHYSRSYPFSGEIVYRNLIHNPEGRQRVIGEKWTHQLTHTHTKTPSGVWRVAFSYAIECWSQDLVM
jgi:hypothetical protein